MSALPNITLQRGVRAYLKRVVTAGDVFTNVLTGGLADETLSARWERNDRLGGPVFSHFASVVLTWFQFHHGMRALAHDEQRAENVAETEREAEGMSDRDLFAWLKVIHEWQVAIYDQIVLLRKGEVVDPAQIEAIRTTLKTSSDALAAAVAAQAPTKQ